MTLLALPLAPAVAGALALSARTRSLQEPLLALFPHGLQHGARRNAYQAMGLAAAGRRDHEAAEDALARARSGPASAAR